MILAGPVLTKLTGSANLPVEASSIASGASDPVVITVTGATAGDGVTLDIPDAAFGLAVLGNYFAGTNTVTVNLICRTEDEELYWAAGKQITATIIK